MPWWEVVAAGQIPTDVPDVSSTFRKFADILSGMRKIVISDAWASTPQRSVINGMSSAHWENSNAPEGDATSC